MEWSYVDSNQERQPFDEADLGDRVRDGTIGPETLIWNETMEDWMAAGVLFPAWFPGTQAGKAPDSFAAMEKEIPPAPAGAAPPDFDPPTIPSLDDVPAASAGSSPPGEFEKSSMSSPDLPVAAEPEPEPKPGPRVRRAAAGASERVEMIKDFASYLNANRGWVKFFGVLSIILGSLLCLSIGGALIGWLPIWLGASVFQSARAADLAERTGSREYLEEALYRLGFFFKLNGIFAIAVIALFLIGTVVLIVTGVLATLVSRVPAG